MLSPRSERKKEEARDQTGSSNVSAAATHSRITDLKKKSEAGQNGEGGVGREGVCVCLLTFIR